MQVRLNDIIVDATSFNACEHFKRSFGAGSAEGSIYKRLLQWKDESLPKELKGAESSNALHLQLR